MQTYKPNHKLIESLADRITQEVNLIIAEKAQLNSVARIPTRDPQDTTVVDEAWFERRRQLDKGHQAWKP
jgi:hypothetical protein